VGGTPVRVTPIELIVGTAVLAEIVIIGVAAWVARYL
jgi:hypothetical protein